MAEARSNDTDAIADAANQRVTSALDIACLPLITVATAITVDAIDIR